MSTSRWPRVLLESGPAQAGFAAGDAVAVAPDHAVFVARSYWRHDRMSVMVRAVPDAVPTKGAWRFSSTSARWEHAVSNDQWAPLSTDTELRIKLGFDGTASPRWTFRLVDDGPAVTAVRRFGTHLCVTPVGLTGAHGDFRTSTWTLLRPDGTLGALDVHEALDSTLTFVERPRVVGIKLFWPPPDLRQLDHGIAKAIVQQLQPRAEESWLDFDGVVRTSTTALEDEEKHALGLSLFWRLTRGEHPYTDEERAEAQRELDAAHPADVADIAAVVRALRPLEWAREQQLLEECAMLPR